MTLLLPANATRRHRSMRAACAAALSTVAVVASLITAAPADAAPRTKSAVVAADATEAVDALDRWHATGNPVDYVRFVQARDEAAARAEVDVELPAGSLQAAWSGVPIAKQEALLSAVSQLGVPYRSLASEPGVGFDCSGLTIWAFAEAGVEIPRVSGDQIRASHELDREQAEAGDLVYYPGHISIYLGAGVMVHAPNTGSHVEIVHLPTTKRLRFGDTVPQPVVADLPEAPAESPADSLMDRALAVSE